MIERPEFKNPFQNAKVVGSNVDATIYLQNDKRGETGFEMSRSEIVEFLQSPSKWIRGSEDKSTTATEWGTLIDCLVLTPDKFDNLFAITPETYTNEKGEQKPWNFNANVCKAWKKEHEGKLFLSAEELKEANNAVARLKADEEIGELLSVSARQVMVTAEYFDRTTKIAVPVKCLIDLLPDAKHPQYGKDIADLKTARNASLGGWEKAIHEHGYDVQAALILDLYTAATREDRTDFKHIISENVKPYEPGKRIVSGDFINLGRDKYLYALRTYCQCLKTGYWPNYEDSGSERIGGWVFSTPRDYMAEFPNFRFPIQSRTETHTTPESVDLIP